MQNVMKFICDMKAQYPDMNDRDVLEAVQTDSQHQFIMGTQGVTEEEATRIIEAAEDYLIKIVYNPNYYKH